MTGGPTPIPRLVDGPPGRARTMATSAPLDLHAVRWVVRIATRAPSIHNTQPWIFVWDGQHLDLHADGTRRLEVVDPLGRQLLISCGAALLQARLALRGLGRTADVTLVPDPAAPNLLARIGVRARAEATPALDDWALLWAIPSRVTVRGAFDRRGLADSVRADLVAAARREGAYLTFADAPDERARLARLIEIADRQQEAQARFREEIAAWVRPDDAPDGMPPWATGHGWLDTPGDFRLRNFDVGHAVAPRRTPRAGVRWDSPTIAILATPADAPRSWLAAGQALARVLLGATRAGVRASMLNQPLEVEGARGEVSGDGYPQMLLRLGYAPAGRPTPRRPVDDVLVVRAAEKR